MFWRKNKEIEELIKLGKEAEAKEKLSAPIDVELCCPYCGGATKRMETIKNAGVDANGTEYRFDDNTKTIKVKLSNGFEKKIQAYTDKEFDKMRKQIEQVGLSALSKGGISEVESGNFKGLFKGQCSFCADQLYFKNDANNQMTAVDVANKFGKPKTISLEELRKN